MVHNFASVKDRLVSSVEILLVKFYPLYLFSEFRLNNGIYCFSLFGKKKLPLNYLMKKNHAIIRLYKTGVRLFSHFSRIEIYTEAFLTLSRNGLVVKLLDSQSRGIVFKTVGSYKVNSAFDPSGVD